jgi:hypothetical protein
MRPPLGARHLLARDGLAICGMRVHSLRLVLTRDAITCRSCLRALAGFSARAVLRNEHRAR